LSEALYIHTNLQVSMTLKLKPTAICIFLLLISLVVRAQDQLPDRFGVFFIYNNSNHYEERFEETFYSSLGENEILKSIGVAFFYGNRLNRSFGLRTQIAYLNKGFLYSSQGNYTKVNFHTIDVSYLLTWSILPTKKVTPYVVGGLNTGYVQSTDIDLISLWSPTGRLVSFPHYENYKKFNGGYNLGIGLRIDEFIFFEVIRKRDIKPFIDESTVIIRNEMFLFKLGVDLRGLMKRFS